MSNFKSSFHITCMFLNCGRKPEYLEGNHADTRNIHKRHTERRWPRNRIQDPLAVRQHCLSQNNQSIVYKIWITKYWKIPVLSYKVINCPVTDLKCLDKQSKTQRYSVSYYVFSHLRGLFEKSCTIIINMLLSGGGERGHLWWLYVWAFCQALLWKFVGSLFGYMYSILHMHSTPLFSRIMQVSLTHIAHVPITLCLVTPLLRFFFSQLCPVQVNNVFEVYPQC